MNIRLALSTLLVSCALSSISVAVLAQDEGARESFFLQMRDGSILSVAAEQADFEWQTVDVDGTVTTSSRSVKSIRNLVFAKSPASVEVARIRALVMQLQDDSYKKRHYAEQTLLNEGKLFVSVIEQQEDHRDPEVRYRVRRILKSFKKSKKGAVLKLEFDEMETEQGENLSGDLGNWKMICHWNGVELKIDRSNCARVSRVSSIELTANGLPAVAKFEAKRVLSEFEFFDKPPEPEKGEKAAAPTLKDGYTWYNFDRSPKGEKLATSRVVDARNMFAYGGLRLACENNEGRVIVAGFRFKKSVSRTNSIGTYFLAEGTGERKSYKGQMRLEFCVPGGEFAPACINEIGAFIEIVSPHSTIMEAFNSAGHVIGLVQSNQDRATFAGFRTNEPIAWIRVSANPYLPPEIEVNEDFALDDLCMGETMSSPEMNFVDGDHHSFVIVTKSNERLLASSVSFSGDEIIIKPSTDGFPEYRLPWSDVHWFTGPQSRETRIPGKGIYAMLKDGSVIHSSKFSADGVASTSNDELVFPQENIIGYWGSEKVARYPSATDFENGKIVLVRPLNSVAFTDASFDWDKGQLKFQLDKAKTIAQTMGRSKEDKKGMTEEEMKAKPIDLEAPAITDTVIADLGWQDDISNDSIDLSSVSSLWTAPPSTRQPGTGLLRLDDGQQFVLGGTSGFEFVKTDGQTVVIKNGSNELVFKLENVHAINLPGQ